VAKIKKEKIVPPRWINILKKQPKDGQIVITYHNETGIDLMKCHVLKGEDKLFGSIMFTSCLGFLTDDVTHWMPLGMGVQEKLHKLKYA